MEEKHFDDENTIIELNSVTEDTLFDDENAIEVTEVNDNEIKVKKPKRKSTKIKRESFWKRIDKKTKIMIIILPIILILIVAGILVYFLVFAKEEEIPEPPVENVVIEKDNYIYDNGLLKLLDATDQVLGTYECVDDDVNKCYVASFTVNEDLDLPKYVYEDGRLATKKSKIYNNQYVFIYDDGAIVLYDLTSKTTEGKYTEISSGNTEENLIVVKDESEKYGLLEISDEVTVVLENKYDYLAVASDDNKFVVKENGYSYLINKKGKAVTSKVRGDIKNFSNDYLSVYDDAYLLYNYEADQVLEGEYDYIDFVDNYTFVIDNKKIYGYDEELFKLNETALKAKNEDYVKTYVFDENNNLIETKAAYNITVYSDNITFEFSDETTKSINLYEVALNKKTDYINYYNGVLYFYKDLEKTEALGTYECNNPNKILKEEDTYSNCFVAKDLNIVNQNENLGYIPIINEKYAFINDTKTGATRPTIVLYDLNKESQLVKYQAVDTGIGMESINYVTSTGSYIYAKNMDGNLGVIAIKEDKAQGVIAFKDDEYGGATKKIGFLDEYFYITREDGNYLYSKTNGTKPIASSQFEIIKYQNGYMVVKDKKYLIYKMASSTSGTIISNEHDYIELNDTFFVGIKDKKLNIYDYKDGKTKLIEDLDLLINDVKSAYKVTKYSDCYIISVVQSDAATIDYKYNLDWSKVDNENAEQ